MAFAGLVAGQTASPQHAERPTPPVRDPHSPGYVDAKELPDNGIPSPTEDGNFIIGPVHSPSPEVSADNAVSNGTVIEFTMNSTDSKIYPGIAREPGTFGTVDPADPAKLIVTTSHPASYMRKVAVYVPKSYVAGTAAPFIVGADGPDRLLFSVLDNLIAQRKLPVMIAISIGNGGGDAQGSERGLEYDTMSGKYAEFVESEVLPRVEAEAHVKLTKDPDGRAAMGASSGAACAFIMAWYHPELYHRVLSYSGTFVNQQWPYSPETPHGAWEFHEHLIPQNPAKPIRIWMEVGDRDLLNPNVMHDGMHDWVLANENMARVLAAKGYHYQFVFARNAGHVDRGVRQETLAEALQYVWQGYSGSHSIAAMDFSDKPNFTVAGVTDWTAAGGHGSDVSLRTSEALARDTKGLGEKPSRENVENSQQLLQRREEIKKQLSISERADLCRELGDIDEQLNDPLAAVHDYEHATQLDPSERNYFAWATELLLHRAIQPATEVFAKGAKAYPSSERMLAGLGAALYASGLYSQAAERVCAASDLKPEDPAPYLFLGKMVKASAQPLACADEKLARFAQSQPQNAAANYYYALALWRAVSNPETSAVENILPLLEKSTHIDPRFADAYLQLGIIYSAQADSAKAIAAYQRAIIANPDLAEAHFRLAQAFKKVGEASKAQQEFQAYEQIEKADSAAVEQQRREIQQFVVVFKDQPQPALAHP